VAVGCSEVGTVVDLEAEATEEAALDAERLAWVVTAGLGERAAAWEAPAERVEALEAPVETAVWVQA
jgi:hypothetical protein